MAKDKVAGVYCIENIVNNKKYIGLTRNINKRLQDHKYKLKNNKHENDLLQKSFNKYGFENFKFYILETTDDLRSLSDMEIYYIEKYNTLDKNFGFNIMDGGSTGVIPKEYIEKRSFTRSKRVAQFDLDNNFIQIHLNAREICRTYGLSEDFSNAIYRCCRNLSNSSYGYRWKFVEKEEYVKNNIFSVEKYPLYSRNKVLCFNIDGNFEKCFDNYTVAQNEFNPNGDNIRLCCVKKSKTAYNKIWIYEDDYFENGIDFNYLNSTNSCLKKAVVRCDKDTHEEIERYESARIASEQGYSYKNISAVCTGKSKTHKGFYWKFV